MTNMVNGINGNEPYDYTQLKMPSAADSANNGEKFSLAYQRTQEESEDEDKKDKPEKSEGEKAAGAGRTLLQGGVRLELSGSGQAEAKRNNTGQTQSAGQGLLESVRTWLSSFVQSVKELLYKIWNDPASQEDTILQQDVSVQDETAETSEPERLTEEYRALKNLEELQNPEDAARQKIELEAQKDKEIQKLLRSGNMEQVLSLVTENGRKTMAKNSTLLTYYDRTGKISPLSASDQERILHGDRSTRKL